MARCAECGQDEYQILRDLRERLLDDCVRQSRQPQMLILGMRKALLVLDDFMAQFKTLGE